MSVVEAEAVAVRKAFTELFTDQNDIQSDQQFPESKLKLPDILAKGVDVANTWERLDGTWLDVWVSFSGWYDVL